MSPICFIDFQSYQSQIVPDCFQMEKLHNPEMDRTSNRNMKHRNVMRFSCLPWSHGQQSAIHGHMEFQRSSQNVRSFGHQLDMSIFDLQDWPREVQQKWHKVNLIYCTSHLFNLWNLYEVSISGGFMYHVFWFCSHVFSRISLFFYVFLCSSHVFVQGSSRRIQDVERLHLWRSLGEASHIETWRFTS